MQRRAGCGLLWCSAGRIAKLSGAGCWCGCFARGSPSGPGPGQGQGHRARDIGGMAGRGPPERTGDASPSFAFFFLTNGALTPSVCGIWTPATANAKSRNESSNPARSGPGGRAINRSTPVTRCVTTPCVTRPKASNQNQTSNQEITLEICKCAPLPCCRLMCPRGRSARSRSPPP